METQCNLIVNIKESIKQEKEEVGMSWKATVERLTGVLGVDWCVDLGLE